MSGIIKYVFKNGPLTQVLISRQIRQLRSYPGTGAVEVFVGQVRPDQKGNGKRVDRINYSCYRDMAKRELVRIYKNTFEMFAINKLTIRHSMGDVPAGNICFFVGVSAGHREDARQSVAFVVDAIKSEVPIFGKEILGDSSHIWKINR